MSKYALFNDNLVWIAKENKNTSIPSQIYSFSTLPDGWHYGEGCGATKHAVTKAMKVYSQLLRHKIDEIEVYPGIHGGISIFGYRDGHVLEVFCDQNGFIDILHEVSGNTSYEKDDISLDEVVSYLRGLPWMAELSTQKLLGFSTLNYSIKSYNASPVMLSPCHQITAVYPSYRQDAPERAVALNANTFLVTTSPRFRETHLYSGELPPPTYRLQPN